MRKYRLGFSDCEDLATLEVDKGTGYIQTEVLNSTMWLVMGFKIEEVKSEPGDKVEATGEESGAPTGAEKKPPKRKPKPRRRGGVAGGGEQRPEPSPSMDSGGTGESEEQSPGMEAPSSDSNE